MRFLKFAALLLVQLPAMAQVAPETIGVETMPESNGQWFFVLSNGAYIFDSTTGNMLGQLPLTKNTPAVAVGQARNEIYAAESHWSRTYRGDREDFMAVYNGTTLYTDTEVSIPAKTAALRMEGHIGITNDEQFVLMYNMTPAQSVTVVNAGTREFAGEVSTPGCGVIMPVGDRSFMMLCGDGTLQTVDLGADGQETDRRRTKTFFSVQEDAVFDRTVRTSNGWLLISHEGQAYNVNVNGSDIEVSDPWWLTSEEEREQQWKPGGLQLIASHQANNLTYILMQPDGEHSHRNPGVELWVFDADQKKRVARWPLENSAMHVLVTQHTEPRLLLATVDAGIQIFDAKTFRHERTIEEFGGGAALLQVY